MSTFVRPYRKEDAAVLRKLSEAVVSSEQFHRQIDHATQAWALEQRGRCIGFATIDGLPGLPGLFALDGGILPPYRRGGYGSLLLEAVLADGRRTAVNTLTHPVARLDSPAGRFLIKNDFVIEHVELVLERRLSQPLHPKTAMPRYALAKLDLSAAPSQLPVLYQRCFQGTPWNQPYSADEIEATLTPLDEVWLLLVKGETVGFAWLHTVSERVVELEPFGIVQAHWGIGYGRYLLDALLYEMRARGKTAVRLTVWQQNEVARKLYKAAGFVEVDKTFYLSRTL